MEKLRFQYQRILFDYDKLSNDLVRQHLIRAMTGVLCPAA